MIAKNFKKAGTTILCLAFFNYSSIALYGYQSQSSTASADAGNSTEPAPQSAAELESLVAPIALYPDALVAQILTGATFPDQIAIADYWLQENKNLTGSALMQAVDKQSWDASVKALTQFPSVLENMAKNLSWTSSLGDAFHSQQADVMTGPTFCTTVSERVYITTSLGESAKGGSQGAVGDRRAALCGANASGAGGRSRDSRNASTTSGTLKPLTPK